MRPSDKTTSMNVSVPQPFADLAFNPGRRLLLRWNWKTALLSACVRGTVFCMPGSGAGVGEAIGGMGVEAALFATLAGFYGAMAQAFRRAQPVWAATMAVLVIMPTINHSLEYILDYASGTKRLSAGLAASISLSMVS